MIRGNQDLISVFSFPETSSTSNNRWRENTAISFPFFHVRKHPADQKKCVYFSQERGKRILLPFYLFRKHPADILICMWFYTVRDLRSLLSFPETTSTVNNMWFLWLREIRTLFPFLHVWKHPADQIKRIYSSQWFVEIRTLCLFFGFPEMISGKIDQITEEVCQHFWIWQAYELWVSLGGWIKMNQQEHTSFDVHWSVVHHVARAFIHWRWSCESHMSWQWWVQRALGMPSKGHNAVEGCVEETCQVQSLEDDPVMALSERGWRIGGPQLQRRDTLRSLHWNPVRVQTSCSTGKQLLNPSLTLGGGEILDFATCCRNTDTHDVLKEDPITGFIDAYWRFDVRNGWQTVPIRTAACCGSSDTGGKITTEIRR